MDFGIDQVRRALLFLIALILSVAVHEFGHAWTATKLGDPLPASQGRLTLSPIRHIDPIGTLLLPLVLALTTSFIFGWGRPVQTNPHYYTRRFKRTTGHMFVAVSGPMMNLVLALVISVVIMVAGRAGLVDFTLARDVAGALIRLNILLMIFNLLPIPPLDGGAVLAWFLPRSLQFVTDFLTRWGFLILLGLFVTGGLEIVLAPTQLIYQNWMTLVLEGAGL